MADTSLNNEYERPVKIADDVYWVGVFDPCSKWFSNPYLIIDGDEAVLIDGGSRSDFASVMMKIMQAGVTPSSITTLVYQNYNPRLLGNLHHLEAMIGRKDLRIVSDIANLRFIQHHSENSLLVAITELNQRLLLSSGRILEFIKVPFASSAGSFLTFDSTSGTLFTGDLFSCYAPGWSLLLNLPRPCLKCRTYGRCPIGFDYCPIGDILRYHRDMISSERALKYALEKVASVPFTTIAPQHGCVIREQRDIVGITELLANLKDVGIDRAIGSRSFNDLGNVSSIRKRLLKDDPDESKAEGHSRPAAGN
jgi:flavorubredoxin